VEILSSFGFFKAPEYTQPQCTAILDLAMSEEELRSRLSDSTRYNLNAAERRGMMVREGKGKEIKTFIDFLKATAIKKTLVLPIEKDYHEKQFETLRREGIMKLFIAEYQGEPLAASLVVFYGDAAYYLHAANSYQQPKLRASYSLVWHTIMESKRFGSKWFDFWGVAATDSPKDPWVGVTAFKLSFGARRECYERPYDLPCKGNYRVIRFMEALCKPLRKILRFRQVS
jgi:lipid II:glycine glycyltransferase (peptidoglycan interpeptide bridge formation enzyme)